MSYRLFLDDYRFPPSGEKWIIARSMKDAQWYVERFGAPYCISFDHDLADDHYDTTQQHEETGYDFAKWFCQQVMDGRITLPTDFSFRVHSMNPIGAENIRAYMNNFLTRR